MENFQTTTQLSSSEDKFKFKKKWFYIGIGISIVSVTAGLIYGIALALEKEHRKEALFIIGLAIIWALILAFIIGPWLTELKIFPQLQGLR